MTIKTTVVDKTKKPSDKDYPCLMKSGSLVVLMSQCERGVVVAEDMGFHVIGEYRDSWIMDEFTPFKGKITLEQE